VGYQQRQHDFITQTREELGLWTITLSVSITAQGVTSLSAC
jgi:hypothetical protein